MEYSNHSKGRYYLMLVLFDLDRCVCQSLYKCKEGRYLFALDDPWSLKSLAVENIFEK